MQTFFTIIGFTASIAVAMIAVFKVIEAVCDFQEFRKEVAKSLAKIEERLNNLKLP